MPESQVFTGANFVISPENIPEDEVQLSTNVDFSLVRGAATVRKGSVAIGTLTSLGGAVEHIFRHYNATPAPWYLAIDTGEILRVTGGFGGPHTITTLTTGGTTDQNDLTAFTSFRDDVYIASNNKHIMDDGTNVRSWLKPSPGSAPTLAVSTLTDLTVVSTFTSVEGTSSGTTWTSTATEGVDASTNRLELRQAPTASDLNLNGTNTIGDYGIHHIDLSFDEPRNVSRISVDYSIGDTTFTNYYHAELDIANSDADIELFLGLNEAQADADTLIEAEASRTSDQSSSVTIPQEVEEVAESKSVARRRVRPPRQRLSQSKDSFNTWSIPVTKFELIGSAPTAGFANIGSVRLVVEATSGSSLQVQVRNWIIKGAEPFPLHDPSVGYVYWETFARVITTNGIDIKVEESAPSPPSSRLKVANSKIVVTSTNTTPSGNDGPPNGATHRILYRQGGFLPVPYAVSTHSIGTQTITDTVKDVTALLRGNKLIRNLRTVFPTAVRAISEPFVQRLFIGWDNRIAWSLPDNVGAFPMTSEQEVSHTRDRINAMHVWGDTLVIVNRFSIFHMRGSLFEGPQANWRLDKMGSKGGSQAPRATIKTPLGILLVREEGLYLYNPGSGQDQPITWAMEKMGDIFKGNGAFDIAQQKGRIGSGLNQAAIQHCIAEYFDDQIWFGYPDGDSSQTRPNKILVLDFKVQKIWLLEFPWDIRSIFADRDSNALLVGTENGAFLRLQQGFVDTLENGSQQDITWRLASRRWSVSNDTVMENTYFEIEQAGTTVVTVDYDGTSTVTVGTLTNATRDWVFPALNGTFANSAEFFLTGTQSSAGQTVLYHLEWDKLDEPKRRFFWRTPHFNNDYPGDKIFDVHFTDIEVIGTGTVTGVVFVDNVAVMTNTITGPTNGRIIHEQSFTVSTDGVPTVGEIAYTTYTSALEFKLWETRYAARNEPPKMTEFQETIKCEDEHLWHRYNVCVNAGTSGATATHEVFVDGASITTFTSTSSGDNRQSFAFAMPLDTYGRTALVIHRGSGFKLYDAWFDKTIEPDRVLRYQWPEEPFQGKTFPSEQNLKTWIADIHPLNGTVTGTVYADGTAILTNTFTGNRRELFNIALDLDGSNLVQPGTRIEIDYTSTTNWKHYFTDLETEPKPFGKTEWAITYKKIGGASRLDMARSFAMDVEPVTGTATVTSIWDIDGTVFQTNTLTFTAREWQEDIPFAPGGRGFIFQQRLFSTDAFHTWSSRLILERIGAKGYAVSQVNGTPR